MSGFLSRIIDIFISVCLVQANPKIANFYIPAMYQANAHIIGVGIILSAG